MRRRALFLQASDRVYEIRHDILSLGVYFDDIVVGRYLPVGGYSGHGQAQGPRGCHIHPVEPGTPAKKCRSSYVSYT